ncbi:hypothetical protein MAR_023544 [Mya arenaria]|uniref:Mitochondria-eating protein C-terminal domain-containing protein n=1 Tax=Mya arenaria TaxID=6604 RepID=A0ABY7DRE5_MYAAR|nr:hypothetical protein MAR_023544 [Mya arenaria]
MEEHQSFLDEKKAHADTYGLDRLKREMQYELEQKDITICQLQHEKETIKREKEDALNRLSQFVSVQLRDNNPNIVDLNDPNRPMNLAEMFSELYDNEWTAAFSVMEDKLQPEQIVSFLLDMVMESYTFCNEKAYSSWCFVTKWFLPEGAHNAQTVRMALKHGQKRQAQTLFSELETGFCDHIIEKCSIEQLRSAFSNKELAKYVNLCVKVCFLMAVNDPPVIIECPNRGKAEMKFNRDEFKEYTKRGPFLAYYVWPLIRLHAGGPLLGKGVAQGADEPDSPAVWKWSK